MLVDCLNPVAVHDQRIGHFILSSNNLKHHVCQIKVAELVAACQIVENWDKVQGSVRCLRS